MLIVNRGLRRVSVGLTFVTCAVFAGVACTDSNDGGAPDASTPNGTGGTDGGVAAGSGGRSSTGGSSGSDGGSKASGGAHATGGGSNGGGADAGSGGSDTLDATVPAPDASDADASDGAPTHLRVKQIAGGLGFTCALTAGGAVKCWGENALGTLGNGKPVNDGSIVLSAGDVVGLSSGVKRIAAAGLNACAIKSDDHVVCWGADSQGTLNAGTERGSSTPVPVGGFTGTAVDIALAADGNTTTDHGCLVDTASKVWCWGSNRTRQLGIDAPDTSDAAVSSAVLTGFSKVAAGGGSTLTGLSCGLTPGGGVKCWGSNGGGKLGIGSGTDDELLQLVTSTPMQPIGLGSDVIQIASTGRGGTCALTTAGTVKCWGEGALNQLGYSTAGFGYSSTPRQVEGLSPGVVQIAAGYAHFCALIVDGTLQCWGYNQNGQLGDQPPELSVNLSSLDPVVVKGVTGVGVIGVGNIQSCAGLKTGGVLCWGSGRPSGSPLGTEIHPVQVQGI